MKKFYDNYEKYWSNPSTKNFFRAMHKNKNFMTIYKENLHKKFYKQIKNQTPYQSVDLIKIEISFLFMGYVYSTALIPWTFHGEIENAAWELAQKLIFFPQVLLRDLAVSYTHLTLPTKRIV